MEKFLHLCLDHPINPLRARRLVNPALIKGLEKNEIHRTQTARHPSRRTLEAITNDRQRSILRLEPGEGVEEKLDERGPLNAMPKQCRRNLKASSVVFNKPKVKPLKFTDKNNSGVANFQNWDLKMRHFFWKSQNFPSMGASLPHPHSMC